MSEEIENPEQEALWDQILDAWNPGLISTHLYLAQKYTSEFHRDHQGWAALADALWNLSRFDEAYSALRKAEQRWPEDNEAQLLRQFANFYQTKGDFAEEENWRRSALELNHSSVELIYLGGCLARQGKFEEAKEFHELATRMSIDDGDPDEAHLNLGRIFQAEENLKEALAHFEKALEFSPDFEAAAVAKQDVENVLALMSE